MADVNRRLKSQIWSSVVTIVLVEAKNLLPMDIDGLSDPYVKFRYVNSRYYRIYRNTNQLDDLDYLAFSIDSIRFINYLNRSQSNP